MDTDLAKIFDEFVTLFGHNPDGAYVLMRHR
jgi:hypothetical protein